MWIISHKDQLFAIETENKDEALEPIALILSCFRNLCSGCSCSRNLPTNEKIWDIFLQEETRQETMSAQREEDQDLVDIKKVRTGRKKKGPVKVRRRRHLLQIMVLRIGVMWCVTNVTWKEPLLINITEKRKGRGTQQQKQFARSGDTSVRVNELAFNLETSFSVVSWISRNTIFGVGWYVDNGFSWNMTFTKFFSARFKTKICE